jgi:hypothetical protein
MKKIPLLLLSIVIVMTAQAQVFIPKAGVTLSKVHVEVSQGLKSKLGLTLGLAYNYQINDIFSVQPELNFIQKGFRQDYHDNDNGVSFDVEGKFAVNYLEMPVMFKASFGEENLKFFLNAGPSLAIGLGGKFKTEYTITFLGDTESETAEGKVKFGDSDDSDDDAIYLDNQLEFGLQIGAGVLIFDKVMIDLRMTISKKLKIE